MPAMAICPPLSSLSWVSDLKAITPQSLKSKLDVWESERNFILERKIERLESD